MAAPIDFYFDFSSPYGFLASHLIDELAAKYGRTVDWHPILLGVVFKETGMAPLTLDPAERRLLEAGLRAERPLPWHRGLPDAREVSDREPGPRADCALAQGRRLGAGDTRREALFAPISSRRRHLQSRHRRGGRRQGSVDAAAARAAIDDPVVKDALKRTVEAAIGAACSVAIRRRGWRAFLGLDRLDQVERWLATGGF